MTSLVTLKRANNACTRSPAECAGATLALPQGKCGDGTAARRDSVRTPYGQSGSLRGLEWAPSKRLCLTPPASNANRWAVTPIGFGKQRQNQGGKLESNTKREVGSVIQTNL